MIARLGGTSAQATWQPTTIFKPASQPWTPSFCAASSAAHLSSAASFTKVPIAPSAESSVHDKRVLQVIDDFLCDDESASCMIIPAFGVTGHGRTSGAAAASNRNSIKGRGKKSLMLRMILPIQFASAPWPLHPFYATTLIPPSAPLFSCNCKVSH
jgi:hypothetical protein